MDSDVWGDVFWHAHWSIKSDQLLHDIATTNQLSPRNVVLDLEKGYNGTSEKIFDNKLYILMSCWWFWSCRRMDSESPKLIKRQIKKYKKKIERESVKFVGTRGSGFPTMVSGFLLMWKPFIIIYIYLAFHDPWKLH